MKVRCDFVTNSSSSSFIIEKSQLSYGKLLKYLLEMANMESKYFDDFPRKYKWKDVEKDCVAGRFHIIEATEEKPYEVEEDDLYGNIIPHGTYTHHYVIDNDGCGRYPWEIVDEILGRHGIEYVRGYCD